MRSMLMFVSFAVAPRRDSVSRNPGWTYTRLAKSQSNLALLAESMQFPIQVAGKPEVGILIDPLPGVLRVRDG